MKLKVVICGGHLTPALGLIDYLKKRKNYQIHYIGRKYALEGDKALSLEYISVRKMRLSFYILHCGRLQRSLTRFTLSSLAKLPVSIIQSFFILHKIKPAVIVSFGGYVALPVCLAAWFFQIPLITHEQTHILGLTNRIIGKFAKVVCLTWPVTKYLPSNVKTIVTGSPIRQYKKLPQKNEILDFGDQKLPLIYITGGSLGSSSINKVVSQILSDLSLNFRIIHQSGSANYGYDFQKLHQLRKSLPISSQRNYKLVKYIHPDIVGDVFHSCQLVIGRAGANTVLETQSMGKAAVFIPLPWAADNEQEENARRLANFGSAAVIKQSELTAELLLKTINSIFENFKLYERKARIAQRKLIPDGAAKLAKLIDLYAKS